MRVAIAYTPAAPDAPPEDQDGLIQLEAVRRALEERGHAVVPVAFDLNLDRVRAALLEVRPDRVFNLVESVMGQDRLQFLAPALFEAMDLPFTGGGLWSVMRSVDKLEAKRVMRQSGLPTPAWLEPYEPSPDPPAKGERVIVKSAWEHASKGLDDTSVFVLDDPALVIEQLRTKRAHFAERFVDGREFNLSVLCGRVLPPAEILFEGFTDKPRMVNYRAKWEASSFEYNHTPRSFAFSPEDQPLLQKLVALAIRCFHLFEVRGFTRVDFRVDTARRPWILELNINPCLAPDAGFAAAVERAGLSYADAIEQILADVNPARGRAPSADSQT